jgi:hypothetical protein
MHEIWQNKANSRHVPRDHDFGRTKPIAPHGAFWQNKLVALARSIATTPWGGASARSENSTQLLFRSQRSRGRVRDERLGRR